MAEWDRILVLWAEQVKRINAEGEVTGDFWGPKGHDRPILKTFIVESEKGIACEGNLPAMLRFGKEKEKIDCVAWNL